MKRFFLLTSTFLCLLASAYATTYNISADSNNAIRNAINSASAGDIIVLADGKYNSSEQIKFNKSITLKAADGAHPTVPIHYYCEVSGENTKVNIEGIRFIGDSAIYKNSKNEDVAASDYCFYVSDATAGKELHLNGCEFKGFPSYTIYMPKANVIDSCVVNNCYFHNSSACVIYGEKSEIENQHACKNLKVTNSTFSNITISNSLSVIDILTYNYDETSSVKIFIDHCTFYNNITLNTDHSAIRTRTTTEANTTITNCIFAHPTSYDRCAVTSYKGTVSNCLSYNLAHDSKNYRSGLSVTSCQVADPLFTDAANADFSYPGNWVTMSISPARAAGSDGSDLGDPRWYTDETLPATDLSSYFLSGEKAQLSGNIYFNTTDSLYYNSSSDKIKGTAKWKINATRACYISATVNNKTTSSSGSLFALVVLDEDNNMVGDSLLGPSYSHAGDKLLSGSVYIPQAGAYTLKLVNKQEWSGAKLNGVTLSYLGGAEIDIPDNSLTAADAYFNTGATRADGAISYSSWKSDDSWIKWHAHTTESGIYSVTVRINTTNAHSLNVALYEDEAAAPIATVAESYTSTTGDNLDLNLGNVSLTAGKDLVVKVTNPTSGSLAKVQSVTFAEVEAINLDETATTNEDWAAKVNDGNSYVVEVIRTLRAGMYNTFCLPFGVGSSQCRSVFGNDVEIYTLGAADVEDYYLNLTINTSSDIYQGTPVLIVPSHDIVNPVFTDVQFKKSTPSATTKTNANFVGTFVATEISASPDNLFLGTNNTLYFPTDAMPIKGYRCWFVIHDVEAGAPTRARIINHENLVTELELVNGTLPDNFGSTTATKLISNGELLLLRGDEVYNALGQRVR